MLMPEYWQETHGTESTTHDIAARMLVGAARADSTTDAVAARMLAGAAQTESTTHDVDIDGYIHIWKCFQIREAYTNSGPSQGNPNE